MENLLDQFRVKEEERLFAKQQDYYPFHCRVAYEIRQIQNNEFDSLFNDIYLDI